MSDQINDSAKPASAAAALAQALARKRAAQTDHGNGPAGRRQVQRNAAAQAKSMSKPQLRK